MVVILPMIVISVVFCNKTTLPSTNNYQQKTIKNERTRNRLYNLRGGDAICRD